MENNKNYVDREVLFNINLRALRGSKALTDKGLSDELGINLHSIRSYQRKVFAIPPPIYISRICQYFNVTFNELFFSTNIRRDQHNRMNNLETSSITMLRNEILELEKKIEDKDEKIKDRDEKIDLLKDLVEAYKNK